MESKFLQTLGISRSLCEVYGLDTDTDTGSGTVLHP